MPDPWSLVAVQHGSYTRIGPPVVFLPDRHARPPGLPQGGPWARSLGGASTAQVRARRPSLWCVWQAATSDRIDHPATSDRSHPGTPETRRASPTHPAGACPCAARARVLSLLPLKTDAAKPLPTARGVSTQVSQAPERGPDPAIASGSFAKRALRARSATPPSAHRLPGSTSGPCALLGEAP